MATGTMTGFLWALTITSRAYFWQKHDRIMYRASEQTEIAAVHENLRLKRENDVFFLQLLQRDGLLQDDEEEQAAHSAAIIYLNGNRGRLNWWFKILTIQTIRSAITLMLGLFGDMK
jgi:hypothetical protein